MALDDSKINGGMAPDDSGINGEMNVWISVIMGVFNIGKLQVFERAMASVLNQTVQDFEFIICDDGSTDDTGLLLCRYARRDKRIRLLRNERRCGLASALNRCIAAAGGEYLARQDADDISAPDRFQKQLDFLKKHPTISFAGSNVILYSKAGCWGKRELPPYPQKKDFLFNNPFVHGSLMFRKSAFQTAGTYRVAKETRRAEDYDLLMRMYAMGLSGANIQEPLYELLEDTDAWRRRKYRYRVDEMRVRMRGFASLGLLPRGMPYVVKPLAVGLIPPKLLVRLKNGHTIQM